VTRRPPADALSRTESAERAQPLRDDPVATLSLAFDAQHPLAEPRRYLLGEIDEVQIGRARREELFDAEPAVLRIGLADRWLSSTHAVLRREGRRWLFEDRGSKNGSVRNGARVDREQLSDGDVLELGHSVFVFREEDAPGELAAVEGFPTLRGSFATALGAARRLATSPISIVVRGESGTGKEVLAALIHRTSGRAGPFVAVNCGALPAALVESELFGYRKGAFSGANEDRPGLVRSASGGTLFLDEIGDLPLPMQTALLRVLQQSEVLPLGAVKPVPVDLRVLAATHRDLPAMADAGSFRPDLLARLAGLTVELLPLRERREDLGLLISALLRRHFQEDADAISFSAAAARAIFLYRWPLNVRELEKTLVVAVELSGRARIELAHLPDALRVPREPQPAASDRLPLSRRDQARKDELIALLRALGGNVTSVARQMGKDRAQIQRWLKRYDIDAASFRE
jgi:transcriptional regulator of acetoin/glycerol metabolism